MRTSTNISSFPLYSVAIISAAALSYEVLLTRLFSIIQYHHFAYMIISLALLGYGVSGTLLSLFRDNFTRNYKFFYIINIVLFSCSTIFCFLLVQAIAFNAEELLWDYSQSFRLFFTYLLLMLPFLFAANAIGLSLIVHATRIGTIYGADLLGAGTGSIGIIVLLYILSPDMALPVLAAIGIFAALIGSWELKYFSLKSFSSLSFILVFIILISDSWLTLEISPYKGLPQLLRVQDARIIASKSSPLGLLHVVESPGLPLRYAPGLSLNARTEPPSQLAVFTDGDGMAAINARPDNANVPLYLDQLTSAAVYHLVNPLDVLIMGAGTGNDILQAQYHQAFRIDAVELNSQMIDLMTNEYADYSGNLFNQPNIKAHNQDARGFITNTDKLFDVIQFTLLDSRSASSSGLYALSENYLYTVEAIKEYLHHLKPGGYLSITRWIKLPPRDSLKMLATIVNALHASGNKDPAQQLIFIRGWQTSTILVKNGIINDQDIKKIQRFCNERLFDTAYFPGIQPPDTNKYNILKEPFFYQAAIELTGRKAQEFLQKYKFNLTPASDDQPYFANFFKWELFTEIISLKESGGMPLMEWGYIVLIATLIQAILASTLLIFLPLLVRQQSHIETKYSTLFTLLYFTALGLGFLFIEIAFMQKFTLFLYHPLYSIAVILAAFLLFSGLGSSISKHWQEKWGYTKSLTVSITGIVICGIIYSFLLDSLFELALGLPTISKILLTGIVIAPLALCMGLPFPLALSYLSTRYPRLIPWAWGVNGCASVISAVLAMLLAIHFGFTVVILWALALYLFAWLIFMITLRKNQVSDEILSERFSQ